MDKKQKNYTFTGMIRMTVILVSIVLILNVAASVTAIAVVWQQNKNSAMESAQAVCTQMNNVFRSIEQTLSSELLYDTDITRLSPSGGSKSLTQLQRYQMIRRLKNILESIRKQYDFLITYGIYIPENDETITSCVGEEDYFVWYDLEPLVKSYVLESCGRSNYVADIPWHIVEFNGKQYLMTYYRINQPYMFCYISVDSFLNSALFVNGKQQQNLFFLSRDGDILCSNDEGKYSKKDFSEVKYDETNMKSLSGVTMTKTKLDKAEFELGIVADNYSALVKMLITQITIGVLLMIAVISCMAFVLYIRKSVISPIQTFSDNMEQLKKDDTYTVATHYQINELGHASELLADMVEKIKKLKISIYEQTLKEQKIQSDFLSLQIEPHFYLNCLNIIYNMAELERYKDIQGMSRCVADYLRYIFRHHDDLVQLSSELEHIEKYLEIQKNRYRDGFRVEISADPEVLNVNIPPLLLQTFVENAIKHTVDWEEEIEISVKLEHLSDDGRDYVEITILDSGEGFEPEILKKLQEGKDISEGEKRIGIMNAILRLKLVYQDQAIIRFYNRSPHGAGIYMRLPYTIEPKGE